MRADDDDAAGKTGKKDLNVPTGWTLISPSKLSFSVSLSFLGHLPSWLVFYIFPSIKVHVIASNFSFPTDLPTSISFFFFVNLTLRSLLVITPIEFNQRILLPILLLLSKLGVRPGNYEQRSLTSTMTAPSTTKKIQFSRTKTAKQFRKTWFSIKRNTTNNETARNKLEQ